MKILGLLGKTTDEGLSGLSRLWDAVTGGAPEVQPMRAQSDQGQFYLDKLIRDSMQADLPMEAYQQGYTPSLFRHVGKPGLTEYDLNAAKANAGGSPGGMYTSAANKAGGSESRMYLDSAAARGIPAEVTPIVSRAKNVFVAGVDPVSPELRNEFIKAAQNHLRTDYFQAPAHRREYMDGKIRMFDYTGDASGLLDIPREAQRQMYTNAGYDALVRNRDEMVFLRPEMQRRPDAQFDPNYTEFNNLLASRPEAAVGAAALGGGLLATDAMNNEAEAGGLIKLLSRTVGDTPTSSFMDEPIISTRYPTAVRATEDPLARNLIIDTAAMDPVQLAKNTSLLGQDVGMRTAARAPEKKAIEFQRKLEENLLHLSDVLPTEFKEQAALWYDGANKIANDFSVKFERSPESVAGVIAAMSPQKDWFQNVSLAERVLDTYGKASGKTATPEMVEKAKSIKALAKYGDDIKAISEKPFEELTDRQKALWIRSYDETYNTKAYRKVNPDGKFQDWATKKDGEQRNVAWGSLNEIKKAVSVLENPSKANISAQMGDMHKVRNFYNNIINPSDPTSVTIDTHAVAADMVKPLSGKSPQVEYNFGTGATNSAITGAKGTYGIHADAYRGAAAQEGILPRQMQSITWEAIRSIIPDTLKKNPDFMDRVTSVWNAADRGFITKTEARDQIIDMAGGVRLPDWYQPGLDVRNIPAKSDSTMRAAAPASLLGGGAATSVEPSPLEAEVANMMGSIGVDYREDPNFNYSMFLPWRKPKSVMYGDGSEFAMPTLFRDILRGALTAEKAGKYGNDEAAIKGLLDSML
jgi:hypothetical protein